MGYFQVRYDSRVVNYNCRGFVRLATDMTKILNLMIRRSRSVDHHHGPVVAVVGYPVHPTNGLDKGVSHVTLLQDPLQGLAILFY